MIAKTESAKSEYKNIWVVAEQLSGVIQQVTMELIGAARPLANDRNSEVWVFAAGPDMKNQAKELFGYGADKVIVVEDDRLLNFNDELEANILGRLIEKYKPEVVICGATTRGRALIPRVAVTKVCGLTADCTELSIDPENGDLLQTRPAFGGNIMATIRSSNHRPQMSTVRPRVMKVPEPDTSLRGEIISESIEVNDTKRVKKILEVFHSEENTVNLADAQIIISGGRGMKGPKGFDLLKKLAAKVEGAVGASRAAVDAGWIAYNHQVGQTGQTVQTKVYMACGISGQIQHLVGMQSSDLIIAIDKDPNTPLMQMADIAVEGDLFEILPKLLEEIPKL